MGLIQTTEQDLENLWNNDIKPLVTQLEEDGLAAFKALVSTFLAGVPAVLIPAAMAALAATPEGGAAVLTAVEGTAINAGLTLAKSSVTAAVAAAQAQAEASAVPPAQASGVASVATPSDSPAPGN